jgi:hypothetical protein
MNAPAAKNTLATNLAILTSLGGIASMVGFVFTYMITDPAVTNSQLEARVTAVEKQVEPLAKLPMQMVAVETELRLSREQRERERK